MASEGPHYLDLTANAAGSVTLTKAQPGDWVKVSGHHSDGSPVFWTIGSQVPTVRGDGTRLLWRLPDYDQIPANATQPIVVRGITEGTGVSIVVEASGYGLQREAETAIGLL